MMNDIISDKGYTGIGGKKSKGKGFISIDSP